MRSLRHDCAKNGCLLHRRWDPGYLGTAAEQADGGEDGSAFPRGSTPTDLDACLDVRGSVLIIETKTAGLPMPTGQLLALKSLWKLGATILIQFCETPAYDDVESVTALVPGWGRPIERQTDRLGRDRMAQDWAGWADAHGDRRSHPWRGDAS